jgi:hypothetical protein
MISDRCGARELRQRLSVFPSRSDFHITSSIWSPPRISGQPNSPHVAARAARFCLGQMELFGLKGKVLDHDFRDSVTCQARLYAPEIEMHGLAAGLRHLTVHHLVPDHAPAGRTGETNNTVAPGKSVSGLRKARRKKEPEHVFGQRVG